MCKIEQGIEVYNEHIDYVSYAIPDYDPAIGYHHASQPRVDCEHEGDSGLSICRNQGKSHARILGSTRLPTIDPV
jgi:hypothetical protein